MTKKKIFFIFFLIILILLIILLLLSTRKKTSQVLPGEIEIENSYLFATPLMAVAGGQEKIRVTVFVLSHEGKGVEGQIVSLGNEGDLLSITGIQTTTDAFGRAIFDISATRPAVYSITGKVGRQALPQRVNLIFK